MSAFLILWCVAGLGGWWFLWRRAAGSHWNVPDGSWQVGDAVIGGLFALLIGWGIFSDRGETRALTVDDLRNGVFVYVALSVMILGIAVSRGGLSVPFGLKPASPLAAVLVGVAAILMTYPLVEIAQQIVAQFGPAPGDGDEMVQFLLGKTTVAERAWAIGLAVVVAPVTEELIFRGYLYGVIKKYGGRLAGMLTSAVLFAAMHNNVPAILPLVVLAIGFTLAYELTGSLWTSITMHALFNLAPVVIILYFPEWIPKF